MPRPTTSEAQSEAVAPPDLPGERTPGVEPGRGAWRGRGAWLGRGAWAGASFGLAAATMEVVNLAIGKLRVGVAAPGSAMWSAVLLELALGAALGLLASPLLQMRRGTRFRAPFDSLGPLLHLGAVLALWVGLGLYAGLPELSLHRTLAIVPWIVAAPLVLLGRWVAGRGAAGRRAWLWRSVPPALAAVTLAVAILAPNASGGAAHSAPPAGASAPTGAPDVVVVVLDTVRADHVGAYGYGRDTTPNLDALALDGAIYMDATAPATWSLPSHASLFTGRFLSSHGAHGEHRHLGDGMPTLAERFAEAGYDTRCFTANAWISDSLGLTRGFRWSDEAWRTGEVGFTRFYGFRLLDRLGFGARDKGGSIVAANFEAWARETPADAPPTFAFLNFIEAHFPYHQVPDAYLERFSQADRGELRDLSLSLMEAQFGGEPPDPAETSGAATDMYDAGVTYADSLLGRVVAALRARGTLDHTVLVVLSDHGESLGEHGAFGHGSSIYEVESRVPLVVRYPARIPSGARTDTPVSTVGVFATVLDLAGLSPPPGLEVSSLVPASSGGPPGGPVISERFGGESAVARSRALMATDPLMRSDLRFRAFRVGSSKLVEGSDGSLRLFDLDADPGELRDVAEERPADVARLRAELLDWRSALGLPGLAPGSGEAPASSRPAPELDEETRARLRALGYIE